MYDLKVIVAMNNEKTREAKKDKRKPYIAKYNGDEGVKTCKILGDYTPQGWEEVNSYFVDSSGLGSESEPALTFKQLLEKVKKGFGYAIGEVGQFQLYIIEYKRI